MTDGPMGHDDFVNLFNFRVLGRLLTEAPDSNEALTAVQTIREMFRPEGDDVFRAWMFGMNPHLDNANPLREIIAGRHQGVLVAARAYMQGDWTPRDWEPEVSA